MAARILEIILTLATTLILGGLILWGTGAVDPQNLLAQTPKLLFVGLWVGILAWIILLVVTAVRDRARGRQRRPWNNFACAALAAIINFVVLTIIGFSMGGWSVLLSIVSAAASVAFVLGATLATLIVNKFGPVRNPPSETPAAT